MIRKITIGLMSILAALIALPISAAIIKFEGIDPGAGPNDPRPNSTATAFEFDMAAGTLGALNLIDFESVTPTFATSVTPLPGVTMNFFNSDSAFRTIRGTDFTNPINSIFSGYNTTPSGTQWALIAEQDLTKATGVEFVFDSPIQAWGAFLTGAGTNPSMLSVTFNDGTFQSLPVTGDSRGGIEFFGFTDAGKFIHSVTFSISPPENSNDAVGIDDVRFVLSPQVQPVPEPFSLLLMLMGIIILGVYFRLNKTSITLTGSHRHLT